MEEKIAVALAGIGLFLLAKLFDRLTDIRQRLDTLIHLLSERR